MVEVPGVSAIAHGEEGAAERAPLLGNGNAIQAALVPQVEGGVNAKMKTTVSSLDDGGAEASS